MRRNKGFTLIELLVVVAIITVLAGLVLTSLDRSRARSRDARRMEDLAQIRTALELYHIDHGRYPVLPIEDTWAGTTGYAFSHCVASMEPCGWVALASLLQPYIKELPRDPKGPPNNVQNVRPWNLTADRLNYAYLSLDGTTYDLVTKLEDPESPYRCGLKQYVFKSGVAIGSTAVGDSWCGAWSPLLYAVD